MFHSASAVQLHSPEFIVAGAVSSRRVGAEFPIEYGRDDIYTGTRRGGATKVSTQWSAAVMGVVAPGAHCDAGYDRLWRSTPRNGGAELEVAGVGRRHPFHTYQRNKFEVAETLA